MRATRGNWGDVWDNFNQHKKRANHGAEAAPGGGTEDMFAAKAGIAGESSGGRS